MRKTLSRYGGRRRTIGGKRSRRFRLGGKSKSKSKCKRRCNSGNRFSKKSFGRKGNKQKGGGALEDAKESNKDLEECGDENQGWKTMMGWPGCDAARQMELVTKAISVWKTLYQEDAARKQNQTMNSPYTVLVSLKQEIVNHLSTIAPDNKKTIKDLLTAAMVPNLGGGDAIYFTSDDIEKLGLR